VLDLPDLTAAQAERYGPHLALPQIGTDGQRQVLAARVLVVGLGGLGSPVALYLAAAGIGTLGLADADTVAQSNLQRQVVHGTTDVGRLKADSAADRLASLNPEVRLVRHRMGVSTDSGWLSDYDVVVDCTDTFEARYLINDLCTQAQIPWVHAAVDAIAGQVTVFAPDGPCYRCLQPSAPDAERAAGVLGPLPGIVGAIQATETLKLVVGAPTLVGRLLVLDAWTMTFDELRITKHPTCPTCST